MSVFRLILGVAAGKKLSYALKNEYVNARSRWIDKAVWKGIFVRKAAMGLVFSAVAAFGLDQTDFGGMASAPVWNSPQNSVFYDHPLLAHQYGFGMIGNVVSGALCFYIGNAFEGAFYGSDSHEGYLSFTGIRYRNWRGPFYGGGTGMLLGSAVTVFFVGDADEDQGSVWLTLFGGALSTAAAFGLAELSGVQNQRSWLPFVPLVLVPPIGAVLGYHVSRWFNDRARRKATETGSVLLLPPRLAVIPRPTGLSMRLDALNLSF